MWFSENMVGTCAYNYPIHAPKSWQQDKCKHLLMDARCVPTPRPPPPSTSLYPLYLCNRSPIVHFRICQIPALEGFYHKLSRQTLHTVLTVSTISPITMLSPVVKRSPGCGYVKCKIKCSTNDLWLAAINNLICICFRQIADLFRRA